MGWVNGKADVHWPKQQWSTTPSENHALHNGGTISLVAAIYKKRTSNVC